MQRIDIRKSYPYSVDKLFDFLSEHSNLETIFAPAKIKRVKDGEESVNGTGSVRQMRILVAPPFEETVTAVIPNERIEYRITKGSPLKKHHGIMRFSSTPEGGSELHYTIEFAGKLPLVAPIVRFALDKAIRRGLDKLKL